MISHTGNCMGMHTELLLKCEIYEDINDNTHDGLCYLFNDAKKPDKLPDHEFFKRERWHQIGSMSSFYHVPFSSSKYRNALSEGKKGGHIFSRSDLKDYHGEIECFIDWVMPYIKEYAGHCIGWTWYEQENSPTLIYKK